MHQLIILSYQPKESEVNPILFSDKEIRAFNRLIAQEELAEEWMVWSTPFRTEVIALINFHRIEAILAAIGAVKNFSTEKTKRLFIVREETEGALEYLSVVALDLKNAVIRTNLIKDNLQKAYKFACGEKSTGVFFQHLMKVLIMLKKEIYQGVHIDIIRKSIAHSAVNMVSEYLSIFSEPNIAIIGFGAMGQNLASRLIQGGVSHMSIFDEKPERVAEFFANQQASFELHSLKSLPSQLNNFELIFSSVSRDKYVITKSTIYKQKQSSFILLVDMSAPKSIDPLINENLGVIRLGLEDIQKSTQLDVALEQSHFTALKEVIDRHLKGFHDWKRDSFYAAIVGELKSHLLWAKHKELDRILREKGPNAFRREEQLIDREIQELVFQSLISLKSAKNECQRQAYLGLIAQMYLS